MFSSTKIRFTWRGRGFLWGGGRNSSGQLGDGTTTDRPTIIPLNSAVWASVRCGGYHTIGIRTDGTLWVWGSNNKGQVGDGTTTDKTSPFRVDGSWKSAAAGFECTLAIKTDGTLWAWGGNDFGQLGDGTEINRNLPVQIGSDTWIAVSSGMDHTVGIKSDGTIWSWGSNWNNQLGTGQDTNLRLSSPVLVDSGSWKSVSCGSLHTLAIKSDNTLWSWGNGGNGQLGRYGAQNIPGQVGDGTWKDASAGVDHSVGIKSDGTIWGWGKNTYGQLGITFDFGRNRNLPEQDPNLNESARSGVPWNAVSCGFEHTLAIKSDNTLWSWGKNTYWQLLEVNPGGGLGDPRRVGTVWASASAGVSHSMAITG